MSAKGSKQPTAGASKPGGKSGRRPQEGPTRPMGPTKEDTVKASVKAARVIASVDSFTIGKLTSNFGSMNSEVLK